MVNKQQFFNAFTNDILMVRGDTLCFDFQLDGLDDSNATFEFVCFSPDSDLFTADSDDGITETTEAGDTVQTFNVWINPQKSAAVDIGTYRYNLRLYTGTDVITLLEGRLILQTEGAE